MHYSQSEESIAIMKRLKLLMDPQGILNPYKTIPGAKQWDASSFPP